MIVDRMTMAHSLEGRSPFVDQEVAEFSARLPADLKLRGRRLKHIARKVSEEFLPKPLLNRGKQGFAFPLARWFSNELRPLTTRLFDDSRLAAEGYFRPAALRGLLNEHVSGRMDHNYRLWLLLNLELWHRLFVDGQTQDELRGLLEEPLMSSQAGKPAPMESAVVEVK
jgi:asparagine synthase (glutamine-hydrolysing)